MKKILYCLTALFAVMLASCSNDDIEVSTTGSLTMNVSTQTVYDQFEATESVRETLRNDGYYLHVMTFLYDKDGNLVTQKEENIKSYNTVQFDFGAVPDGEYTALTIETMMRENSTTKKIESPAWDFVDTEKLSTVKVKQDAIEVAFIYAIGASTDKIVVDGPSAYNVTPNGIGSLVEFYFKNYDKSNYIDAGFATDDIIDYYLFDPSLERSARFHTDVTKKGYTNIRCSIGIDGNNSIHQTRYILEDKIAYDFCFTKNQANSDKGTWTYYPSLHGNMTLEDGKPYYAGSSYVDDNSLSTYFGDLEGIKAWLKTLNGNGEFVPNVYMTWKANVSSVQSFMKGYTMTKGQAGKAVKQEDGSYQLQYQGKDKEAYINYFFETATSDLYETDIIYEKKAVSDSEFKNYVNKNYDYLFDDAENNTYYYKSKDGKMVVVLILKPEYNLLAFIDNDYLNKQGVAKKDMPKYVKKMLLNKAR